MSDQLIAPEAAGPDMPHNGSTLRVAALQAVLIIVGFAIVGALCGLLWESVWSPAQGEVVKHVWYPYSWDRSQPAYFAGAAWYVVIGCAAGIVLGALSALLLDRAELVTLAAVVVGGLIAAYLMRVVGLHRGPGDPQSIAKTAADGTKLPSDLEAGSWWLVLAFPTGAMTSLGVIFLVLTKRGERSVIGSGENGTDPAVQPPFAG